MFIEIEPHSHVAIYIQLIRQIKKAIIRDEVQTGEMLPSVRALASDLGVNMHTVNKAYNFLVEEGILIKNQQGYTVQVLEKIPHDVEDKMKESIDELLVDVFIHDVPIDVVKKWAEDAAKDLKKEWL